MGETPLTTRHLRRNDPLGNRMNCRWTIFCSAFTTLGRVKPEDGTVIETAVRLLPGIYHVDAAIATIVYR